MDTETGIQQVLKVIEDNGREILLADGRHAPMFHWIGECEKGHLVHLYGQAPYPPKELRAKLESGDLHRKSVAEHGCEECGGKARYRAHMTVIQAKMTLGDKDEESLIAYVVAKNTPTRIFGWKVLRGDDGGVFGLGSAHSHPDPRNEGGFSVRAPEDTL